MIIVCRKCKYEISEQEINEHFWGIMLKFAAASIELVTNILLSFSSLRTKIDEDATIEHTNKLLGRANHYEIRCPECFQYNGWIKTIGIPEDVAE
jgi:hypothetical protein